MSASLFTNLCLLKKMLNAAVKCTATFYIFYLNNKYSAEYIYLRKQDNANAKL